MKKGKIIVLSAPSGTGKSTIIKALMEMPGMDLEFSISATSRLPRGEERNGKEYYFLTPVEFDKVAAEDGFVEWEEVYPGTKYGTLVSEVERVVSTGRNLIMDIDVKGALNVKKRYGKDALCLFILPPSVEELENRLRGRNTDTEESIARRIGKAEYELGFASSFDMSIVNDNLFQAIGKTAEAIREFTR